MRDTCNRHMLGDESVEDFGHWAFGEGHGGAIVWDLWKRWNEIHGEKYELKGTDIPSETLPKMVEMWRKERQQAN